MLGAIDYLDIATLPDSISGLGCGANCNCGLGALDDLSDADLEVLMLDDGLGDAASDLLALRRKIASDNRWRKKVQKAKAQHRTTKIAAAKRNKKRLKRKLASAAEQSEADAADAQAYIDEQQAMLDESDQYAAELETELQNEPPPGAAADDGYVDDADAAMYMDDRADFDEGDVLDVMNIDDTGGGAGDDQDDYVSVEGLQGNFFKDLVSSGGASRIASVIPFVGPAISVGIDMATARSRQSTLPSISAAPMIVSALPLPTSSRVPTAPAKPKPKPLINQQTVIMLGGLALVAMMMKRGR